MRLALVGAQHFHMYHLLNYLQVTGKATFVGVYERHKQVREKLSDQFHVPNFDDLEEMLQTLKPDVVACYDVPSKRADTIAQCLRAGVSVLADKPPVLTREQLQDLKELVAESTGPQFSVLLSDRYNPPVRTLKRLVDAGEIGDVVNFTAFRPHKLKKAQRSEWFFSREHHGGILVDLAIHDIDIFRWITGRNITEVKAYAGNFTVPEHPEFEDNGQIIFLADGGVTGLVRVDWLAPSAYPTHGDCRYFVTGTKGMIEVKTGGDIGTTEGTVTVCTETRAPYSVPVDEVNGDLYSDFFTAIATDSKPIIGMEDVYAAMQVVLAARDSADQNRTISL